MNWLSNFARPGLKKKEDKRDTPSNIWTKCPLSGEILLQSDVEAAHWVTPAGFHMRIGAGPRFLQLFDAAYQEFPLPDTQVDPLKFKDDKKYVDRLRAARQKAGRDDCMAAAVGEIGGVRSVVLVQDFAFMGGSLGMAAGEAFIAAAQRAVKEQAAFIAVTAAGGARMQEGILSLMQMPRTTLAVQEVKDAGLPYIVILTDPTTGGVTASYAMLGDVHIAEPGALIGFAGPRVIEQTIREKLPEGFQRAEYLQDKGMVDLVLDRRRMKPVLANLLQILTGQPAAAAKPDAETERAAARRVASAARERPASRVRASSADARRAVRTGRSRADRL